MCVPVAAVFFGPAGVAVVVVVLFVSSVAFLGASVVAVFVGLCGVAVVAVVCSVLSVVFSLLVEFSYFVGFGASVVPVVFTASAFVIAAVATPVVTFGLQTISCCDSLNALLSLLMFLLFPIS